MLGMATPPPIAENATVGETTKMRRPRRTPVSAQRRPVPVIRTTLHRPPLTSGLVPRGRLLELMNRTPEVPLILVSAPAGYGKSVLVSQWVERQAQPSVWLSLDEADSDFRQFLSYLLAAANGP